MHSARISREEVDCVRSALEDVLELFGVYYQTNICERRDLIDTIEDEISKNMTGLGLEYGNQMDYFEFLEGLRKKGVLTEKKYGIVIVDKDLCWKDNKENLDPLFIIGGYYEYGNYLRAIAISPVRLKGYADEKELIKTNGFHEIGHLLNAADGRTGKTLEGRKVIDHCGNEDMMTQYDFIPDSVIELTEKRLESGKIYCDTCIREIKDYLKCK